MKKHREVAALILAAGFSSRMGVLKPLMTLGRATLLEKAIGCFREGGIEDVTVVAGHGVEEVGPCAQHHGARCVYNPRYSEGMLSSVLAGIESLDPGVRAFFLLPADMPLVKARTVRSLLRAYETHPAPVVYPCFRGLRGHPPLIARDCLHELQASQDGGLRSYLQRFDDEALEVDVADEGILMDCDTPDDFRRLQARDLRGDIPTERECHAIWERCRVSEDVRAHSRVVAEVARLLAVHLRRVGIELNLPLILAGGLLHDLLKGQPDHARAGAAWLREFSCPRVAEVVASHMDLAVRSERLNEIDLVHLADKLVEGDRTVPLEKRFHKALHRFGSQERALRTVRKRLADAGDIQARVDRALGSSTDAILGRHARGIRLAAVGGPRHIYLARHGAIERANGPKQYLGQLDPPLSRAGVEQAEALRERLAHISPSAVHCSDLQRSLATAALIAEAWGIEPMPKRELREISLGEWEGLTFEEVRSNQPLAYEERGRDLVHFRPPGGESFLDCASRVIPAFYSVLRETRGDLVVVGHAGVNRILLAQVMGVNAQDVLKIPQEYGCLNVIEAEGLKFSLKMLNGEDVLEGEEWVKSSI